jgi:uncharacterized protein YebE (UPF0316 family)
MENFFTETFGISSEIFGYVVLPLLIFIARIGDVSINTIRIIYVLGGRRWTATMLGFFESFIWLMAIRQIFEHLDNWICYIAYPAGFAMGIFVGMIIEERIAYGKLIVRIITQENVNTLIPYLNGKQYRYTQVSAEGPQGHENLIFTVLDREDLESLLYHLKEILPSAFYTVERVNKAAEVGTLKEESSRWSVLSWLRDIVRR